MSGSRISHDGTPVTCWGGFDMITQEWSPSALRRAFEQSGAAKRGPSGRVGLARAARGLNDRLFELRASVETGELEAFRDYVGEVVTTASPLLLWLCALQGHELDALVHELRPGTHWEPWLCGARPRDQWLKKDVTGRVNARGPSVMRRAAWDFQEYAHCGITVPPRGEGHAKFGLRVLNRGLEMAALLSEHRLRTHGGEGSLTLRMQLPATVMAAMPGMALDRVVAHPLLAGAGCVITGVDEPTRKWGTKVRFALDPVPSRMPWARSAPVAARGVDGVPAIANVRS